MLSLVKRVSPPSSTSERYMKKVSAATATRYLRVRRQWQVGREAERQRGKEAVAERQWQRGSGEWQWTEVAMGRGRSNAKEVGGLSSRRLSRRAKRLHAQSLGPHAE